MCPAFPHKHEWDEAENAQRSPQGVHFEDSDFLRCKVAR